MILVLCMSWTKVGWVGGFVLCVPNRFPPFVLFICFISSYLADVTTAWLTTLKWGLCYQKQVSQTGISNYIPQLTVGCNYLSLPEIPASGNKVLKYECDLMDWTDTFEKSRNVLYKEINKWSFCTPTPTQTSTTPDPHPPICIHCANWTWPVMSRVSNIMVVMHNAVNWWQLLSRNPFHWQFFI